MNYKARSLRAVLAVMLLGMALVFSADALGHARVGAEYNYSLYAAVSLGIVALAAVLFAWNVVQYAVKRGAATVGGK